MRPLIILLAFAMAFVAACTTSAKRQERHFVSSREHAVRLSIWNQADMPIAFTIFVDGQVVLDSTAPATAMRPAVVIEKELDLSPGNHTIVAQDRTRNIRRQVALVLKDIANVDLYLNANETVLVFDYNETRILF